MSSKLSKILSEGKRKITKGIMYPLLAGTLIFGAGNTLKAQTPQNSQSHKWETTVSFASYIPNDEGLRDAIGSYLGLEMNSRTAVAKDFYISPFLSWQFGYGRSENSRGQITDEITASKWDLGALALYDLGKFKIGIGPTINKLGLTYKSGGDKEKDSFSGVGWKLMMELDFTDWIGIIGSYSNVKSKIEQIDGDVQIGATQLGLLVKF